MDISLFQLEGKTAFLPVFHSVGYFTGHTPPVDDDWMAVHLAGAPEIAAASILDDDTRATRPTR
ncbi:MAG: hypothetical protein F4X93_02010 [Proteobacteria bacterium]|nr:hypothetical protein [Pseudomonadota bacterium]